MCCPLCQDSAAAELDDAPEFYHCPTCDLRFADHDRHLDLKDETARYQSHNNDLADSGYRKFLQPLHDAIVSRLTPGQRGLDFGCGPGPLLAQMLGESGFDTQLFDPIFAPQAPAANAKFDFIVTSEVVEHLFQPHKEFAQLYDWLNVGGWIGVMTALVTEQVDFANWYYRRDPTHVVFYSPKTFQWLQKHFAFTEMILVNERIVLLRR